MTEVTLSCIQMIRNVIMFRTATPKIGYGGQTRWSFTIGIWRPPSLSCSKILPYIGAGSNIIKFTLLGYIFVRVTKGQFLRKKYIQSAINREKDIRGRTWTDMCLCTLLLIFFHFFFLLEIESN